MKAVLFVLGLVIVAGLWYLFMPVIGFSFATFWLFLILALLILAIPFVPSTEGFSFTPAGIVTVLFILGWFISTPGCFNASSYRQQLTVEEKAFSRDVEVVDPSNLRIVDEKTAAKIGEKKLGNASTTVGSLAQLSGYYAQKADGRYFYVAPLEHDGFFNTWNNNDIGTPGYVMTSGTDQNDATYIEKDKKGNDIHIVYQPGAWWGKDLDRHIYFSGYMGYDWRYHFETNDDHQPYWVVSLLDTKVGFAGKDVVKVLLVNPGTGHIDEYEVNNVPAWVDRIYPQELIKTQINNWGRYIHGFQWGDKDKVKSTGQISLFYGKSEDCEYYTGITSFNGRSDEALGFILVNSRTKKARWFKMAGTTEEAAQRSAQGRVQAENYVASYPNFGNVDGTPTLIMAMKDQEDLIKGISFVCYEQHSIVGYGGTIEDALMDYRQRLITETKSNAKVTSSEHALKQLTGTIIHFSNQVVNGNTRYGIILKEAPDFRFSASPAVSDELGFTQVGQKVTITFIASGAQPLPMSAFNNLEITDATITPEQQKQTERFVSVEKKHSDAQDLKDADSYLSSLPDSIKVKIMNERVNKNK